MLIDFKVFKSNPEIAKLTDVGQQFMYIIEFI